MIIIPVLSNCSPRKTGLIETIGSGSSFSTVSAPRPYEPVFAYFGKKTDFLSSEFSWHMMVRKRNWRFLKEF